MEEIGGIGYIVETMKPYGLVGLVTLYFIVTSWTTRKELKAERDGRLKDAKADGVKMTEAMNGTSAAISRMADIMEERTVVSRSTNEGVDRLAAAAAGQIEAGKLEHQAVVGRLNDIFSAIKSTSSPRQRRNEE